MDEIEISVKDLYEKAKMMLDDGMDTVVLRLCEADGEGDDALPACVSFEASTSEAPFAGVDYEEIEAISE
ncbi:hypothetical protein [Pseudoflavonifractor phocaeensis]|uniref:hypothetical protein n=1 Tax=Pseudoflavonifractor phocaeensis TaxID=1870988 RepID=UPI0019593173|nr:hypothetical protein [Pseudoflavonifractor phocaeensis]MBM6724322.1 hypothetical protein [Pseudoflavonifractor phocaeensis]